MRQRRVYATGAFSLSLIFVIASVVSCEWWASTPADDVLGPQVAVRASARKVSEPASDHARPKRAGHDLSRSIRSIVVSGRGDARSVEIEIGPEVAELLAAKGGSLQAVLLWDSDGDGRVDRRVLGKVDGSRATFEAPPISLARTHWQIGLLYVAGDDGDPALDRRYLASVDSAGAQIVFRDAAELADVAAGPPGGRGLVILKLRHGAEFDLAEFVDRPGRYLESFDALTPEEDEDDWTVEGDEGRVVTHFDERDVLLVRTAPRYALDVEWGDVPMLAFLGDYLDVAPTDDACYSSLHSRLRNDDGTRAIPPHDLLYCPEASFSLFDAPDGYQIGLSALEGERLHEHTEVATSIPDNVRLYVNQIYPRSASSRATGSVVGNIRNGWSDARTDLKLAFRNIVTGRRRRNIHTGETSYQPSLLTGVPLALGSLARFRPLEAADRVFSGIESGYNGIADVVGAVDNTMINSTLQVTVGAVTSPENADVALDYFGAATQSIVKNLPGGERFNDALSPYSLTQHNRAFAPVDYTRTDTQLNIDRVVAAIDLIAMNAIKRHNDDSSSGGEAEQADDGGGGDGDGVKPPKDKPPKPPKAKPPKTPKPPKAKAPKTPKPPKAKAPKTPKPPKARAPKTPKPPKARAPKTPKPPKAKAPKTPKAPKARAPKGKPLHAPKKGTAPAHDAD